MKKFLFLLVSAIMIFSLFSCGLNNEFIALSNSEVLTIGQGSSHFMNYIEENTVTNNLSYVISATYSLRGTTYESPSDSVKYGDYYFYWNIQEISETKELGERTTTTSISYEYLPYLENEGVNVKKTVKTTVSFNHEGGWVEMPVDVEIKLNGYFSSFEELEEKCPALAAKINTNATRKYYVDVTIPDNVSTSQQFYNTYYYIEQK